MFVPTLKVTYLEQRKILEFDLLYSFDFQLENGLNDVNKCFQICLFTFGISNSFQ